ncbi:MAG: hypothetical protein ACK55I_43465, partial [bacterium]
MSHSNFSNFANNADVFFYMSTDWDEVYDDDLSFLLEHISFRMSDDLFTDINFGFKKETKIKMINGEKPIDKIFIGERVSTGGVV